MSEPIPQPETTTEPAAPVKTLEELLAEAEAKVQEQRDAWLRAPDLAMQQTIARDIQAQAFQDLPA